MTQRMAGTIGTVVSIASERQGVQDVVVRLSTLSSAGQTVEKPNGNLFASSDSPSGEIISEETLEDRNVNLSHQAINIVALTGSVKPGDQVVLNSVTLEMVVGNDRKNIVAALLHSETLVSDFSEEVSERKGFENTANLSTFGQICKLRGTPLQSPVLIVESSQSPHYETLCRFESLQEMPVVCAQLHSQLPAIVAGARWALQQSDRATPRIAFIMTDGGALPLAHSQLVGPLKERDWICATITSGQAFGGDYECVNLYSALATAYAVVKADMVIVCQGPGGVETGSPLGFSGIEQGQAINAVASLGGTAIAAVQVSFADSLPEPRGLSRHSITVLGQITHASALIALPQLPEEEMQALLEAVSTANLAELHQPVIVMANRAFDKLQAANLMGAVQEDQRKEDDRAFLLASCAAGVLAGQLLEAGSE